MDDSVLWAAVHSAGISVVARSRRSIRSLRPVEDAAAEMLTVIYRDGDMKAAAATEHTCGVLVAPADEPEARALALDRDWWVLVHPEQKSAFWDLHNYLATQTAFFGASTDAPPQVHPSARVAPTVKLGLGTVIGADTVLEDFVVVKASCRIGDRVRVGPSCVIGADGFCNAYKSNGIRRHITHLGSVQLESDTYLHSAVHVERGVWGKTTLGRGNQLDNMCHVSHECVLGINNRLAAGVKLGGSARLGDDNVVGLGAVISDGIHIGSRCRIPIGGCVTHHVADDTVLLPLSAMTEADYADLSRALARERARRRGGAR